MNLNELYSQVIKDHNLSKHNKHPLEQATLIRPGKNPACGDEIDLSLKISGSRIEDAAYSGVGCAISQASVSIMIDLIRGKTLSEARELCRLFLNMIRRAPLTAGEEALLEEAMALINVSNMPARVKCAAMPWHTLEDALNALEGSEAVEQTVH